MQTSQKSGCRLAESSVFAIKRCTRDKGKESARLIVVVEEGAPIQCCKRSYHLRNRALKREHHLMHPPEPSGRAEGWAEPHDYGAYRGVDAPDHTLISPRDLALLTQRETVVTGKREPQVVWHWGLVHHEFRLSYTMIWHSKKDFSFTCSLSASMPDL
jgi:hypothetical protein